MESLNSENENLTILLVDDNIDNIQLAKTLLRKQDFIIKSFTSGKMAIEETSSIMPDLILLDIMMPEVDGFEVCKALKKNDITKDIPIVFLSARNDVETIVEGFNIGGADYVTKPFKQQELIARINTQLSIKTQQKTIINQNQKLYRLNQEKDMLMQITAHDLRNPISGISGLLDFIQDNYGKISLDDIKEIIDTAKFGLNSAMNIIGDLMDIYAIENNRLKFNNEVFELNSVLKKIIMQHQIKASSRNIKLSCELDPYYLYLDADKSKTTRIFENLLSNSIKYTKDNSQITIKTFKDNEYFVINILDMGPGFSEEDFNNLYNKYATLSAKPSSKDTSIGLGLFIVKTLVEAMNGSVDIKNNPSGGAVFELKFKGL